MTDEQIDAVWASTDTSGYTLYEAHTWEVEMRRRFARALLAAGASEGQAKPIYQARKWDDTWEDVNETIYARFIEEGAKPAIHVRIVHPSAEIAALREQADEYKRMFEDAVRSLAAIDEALGIDTDEAGGAAPILDAIAALRERIAGMEKDAELYRWLAPRFTGYDFDWMPSEPEAGDGKSVVVFDVGREFRGGRDITVAIGAAIAKEPK